MVLQAACGGGGGGSGRSGSPPPPPPPPPPPMQLAITAGNAAGVAVTGVAGAESSVQLGIAILDSLFELADTGSLSREIECRFGLFAAEVTDNDANGTISPGDSVALDYRNCDLDVIGRRFTGGVIVDVDAFFITPELAVSGNLTATIPQALEFAPINGLGTTASGALDITYSGSETVEFMQVDSANGVPFEISIVGNGIDVTESFRDVSVTRQIEMTDEFSVEFTMAVESELIGGTFDCLTPQRLGGALGFYPDRGSVECAGTAGSKVRLVPVNVSRLDTLVDENGDGNFIAADLVENASGTWGDYIEGTFVATRLTLPDVDRSQIIPRLASESISIAVNDAVYDPVSHALFVSNDNGVVEVDLTTLQPGRSLSLGGRPGTLDISDDGSTLWVGLQDETEIVPIDTTQFVAGTPVALGVTQSPFGERVAFDLAVAPGTTDLVVVAMEGDRETVAYRGGIELPNILIDNSGPTDLEFRDSTSLVAINDSLSSFSAYLIKLDDNGLTLERELRDFSLGFGTELALGNEHAFVSSGRVFDVDGPDIIGRIDFAFGGASQDGLFVDRNDGVVYFYDDLSGVIEFHDETRLLPLGAYRVDSNGALIRLLETIDDRVVFVTESEIHVIEKAVLEPTQLSDPCGTIDLSGQVGLGFYVQTTCRFNAAVYDASRDLVYATIGAQRGPGGNSVAIVDPRTGMIRSTVFVGLEPTRLAMSASGNSLFVILEESTLMVEVDLQTQSVVGSISVYPWPFDQSPRFPVAIAASPVNDTELLVATEHSVDAYFSGTPSANGPLSANDIEALFYRSDGLRAFAAEAGRAHWLYAVDAVGLTALSETRNAVMAYGLKIQNDVFFERTGNLVDPESLEILGTCPVRIAGTPGAVEPEPGTTNVYYWLQGFQSRLVACDTSTFTRGKPVDVPNFGGSVGDVRTLLSAGPDRLIIVSGDKMLLLDPAEIR